MVEDISKVIDKRTNRVRMIHYPSSQDIIRKKLTGEDKLSRLIYEDDDLDKLKEFRNKLSKDDNVSYTIRGNKIYQIKPRQKKIDVVKSTVIVAIQILKKNKLLTDTDTNKIEKIVINDLFDGSKRKAFKIDN